MQASKRGFSAINTRFDSLEGFLLGGLDVAFISAAVFSLHFEKLSDREQLAPEFGALRSLQSKL